MRIIDVTYPFFVVLVIYLYQKVLDQEKAFQKIDDFILTEIKNNAIRENAKSRLKEEIEQVELLPLNRKDTLLDDVVVFDKTKKALVEKSRELKVSDTSEGSEREEDVYQDASLSRSAQTRKPASLETTSELFSDRLENYDKVEKKDQNNMSMIRRYHPKEDTKLTSRRQTELDSLQLEDTFNIHEMYGKDLKIKIHTTRDKPKRKQRIEMEDVEKRRLKSFINETNFYQTSCVLTKAQIIPICDDDYVECSQWAYNDDCIDPQWEDWMFEFCPRSCDICPPPVSQMDHQGRHEENKNIVAAFNISLGVKTDDYGDDISWLLVPKNSEDSIFDSTEINATSRLGNNEQYAVQYNCIISQNKVKEDQFSGGKMTKYDCYDFEVHGFNGDGMCCQYGYGSFSLSVDTLNSALHISDDFKDGSVMNSSFCINHGDGKIHSQGRFITKKQPSHYPFPKWQCRNDGVCICDSKPILSNSFDNDATLYGAKIKAFFQIMVLSDTIELMDVESAQYKAACWVLNDDPYQYNPTMKQNHEKMLQRYVLAVLYFSTSPKNWVFHYHFLSSRSECDWKHWGYGCSCDDDGNIITIHLSGNNLEGVILQELIELRLLGDLLLYNNNIQGKIPSMLGRLSKLRYLSLGQNELEGTIPHWLFNATNLEVLDLQSNRLEGTISETIANLQKLSHLYLGENDLSGSIPDGIYTLKNIQYLYLDRNRLSSSISPLIENMNELAWVYFENNMLSGQIPSSIGRLSQLHDLLLDNNRLSGQIPPSLFDPPYLKELLLQDNSVTGFIPDEFCASDYIIVQADCRNDLFSPEVCCSCCNYCNDETPTWDDECADVSLKLIIHHEDNKSHHLKWSLTNDATGKNVLYDGRYITESGSSTYETCVAHTDCFSINMILSPEFNTNYEIHWDDKLIYDGTFPGYLDNDGTNRDDPSQTLLSFQYNEEDDKIDSCKKIEYTCSGEIIHIEKYTTNRIFYNEANMVSGRDKILDSSSHQTKALCWFLKNEDTSYVYDGKFVQRYTLAILHLMSQNGLFGDDEYPPESHECDWNGITCRDNNTKIVTEISLSSKNNQAINGTLINELGSLQFLEVLNLSQTHLHGTIPRSFANLWSLKQFDLSENSITGTISETLFLQLNQLEYIDFSENILSGGFPTNIASNSNIRTILLGGNKLGGVLSFDKFKHFGLEHFNVSQNKLNAIDFTFLLNQSNLKKLDMSNNFIVGTIHEKTFASLIELQYFNISQNDFSGTIPSIYPVPEISKITYFDAHANRLHGPIPSQMAELIDLKHLNLQGNQLTGSLPSQLNRLQNLSVLVLSHNELKGSIPFDPTTLQKMKRLHLHNNKLSGKAPQFINMISYISDCGFPSDSLEPVSCSTCDICCNSDGNCQGKSTRKRSQVALTLIFIFTVVGFISMCYMMKDYIISNKYLKTFFSETVSLWNALLLISDKSVYHFLLAKNLAEWFVAVCCVVFQAATLFLFVQSADIANENSDREYSISCPPNSLECEDSNSVTDYGLFIFGLILAVWLFKDIVGSVKLMLVSFQKKSIDFFFASALIFTVTMLSLWTSVIYIIAIAAKNTDMIKDAVILLFVVEIDERIFELVKIMNPEWVSNIDNNMRNSYVHEGDNLIITSWVSKSSQLKKMIREKSSAFRRKKNSKTSSGREQEGDSGIIDESEESDVEIEVFGECDL